MTVKRAGETEQPTLSPDGQEELDELSLLTVIRQWNGSYAALKAAKPKPGSIDASGYTVLKSHLKSKAGGQGILTTTVTKAIERPAQGLSAGPIRTSHWTGWNRLQRPLRQHPKWATVDETTWAGADAWEKEEDFELKKAYQYRVPLRAVDGTWQHKADGQPLYDIRDVSGSLDNYCERRLKGVDSYDEWHPVCKRTRVYSYDPGRGRVGMPDTCPKPVSDYVYLKVGDESSDQGSKGMWTRIETWEGYESIDDGLYGPDSDNPLSAPLKPAATSKKKRPRK